MTPLSRYLFISIPIVVIFFYIYDQPSPPHQSPTISIQCPSSGSSWSPYLIGNPQSSSGMAQCFPLHPHQSQSDDLPTISSGSIWRIIEKIPLEALKALLIWALTEPVKGIIIDLLMIIKERQSEKEEDLDNNFLLLGIDGTFILNVNQDLSLADVLHVLQLQSNKGIGILSCGHRFHPYHGCIEHLLYRKTKCPRPTIGQPQPRRVILRIQANARGSVWFLDEPTGEHPRYVNFSRRLRAPSIILVPQQYAYAYMHT